MRLLVFAEDAPGAVIRSLLPGLARVAAVTRVNTANTAWLVGKRSPLTVALRQREARQLGARFLEAVDQLSPDAVLVLKGRGLGGAPIREVRQEGVPVAIYYPDNPFWRAGDTGDALARLQAADLAIVWSERLATLLSPMAKKVEVMPFGYDDRWYPIAAPGGAHRRGVAFVGTWSARRERFLSALDGVPLVVHGLGWDRARIAGGPPLTEAAAGAVLRQACIGVNILHPQNAGSHNMRTREIAACGALELTEPGIDGTPLRDGESCAWFRTPEQLRERVMWFLERPDEAQRLARAAQDLITDDTYARRGESIAHLIAALVPPGPTVATTSAMEVP
jgi:hypothetical protein